MNPSSGNGGTGGAPNLQGAVGSYQSGGGLQAALKSDIAQLGQFATTYQVPTVSSAQTTTAAAAPQLDFFGKLGAIAGETGHIFEDVGQWAVRQGVDAVTGAVDFVPGLFRIGQDTFKTYQYSAQTQELNARLDQLNAQYRSGQIGASEYTNELNQWNKDNAALSSDLAGLTAKSRSDAGTFVKDAVATESDLLLFAGAPLARAGAAVGKAGIADAATWLVSHDAAGIFGGAEETIARLAADKIAFGSLSAATQTALKASVTDSFMNAATNVLARNVTAGQVARFAATKLAFEYPITFNWINGTGNQLAEELQSGKYGEAVKTVGFNLALILSGGPIGQAMKYGGKALSGLAARTFGQTSFLDQLSQGLFGDTATIYQAIKDDPEAIKAFQALEATNVAATDGRVTDAVYRVVNGLKMNKVPEFSSTGMQAKEFLDKYVYNWHKAQSLLHDSLIASGMSEAEASKYVVGRWVVPDANRIAAKLTEGDLPLATSTATEPTSAGQAVDMSGAPDFLQPQGSQVDKIAEATPVARKAGASDAQIKQILEEGVGSNRSESLRVLEQNQAHLSSADRLALTGGDTGQAGLQMASSDRNALLAKFRAQAAQSASTDATEASAGQSVIDRRLQTWAQMKLAEPNAAWANNASLDAQITALIRENEDPTALSDAIRNIEAQFPADIRLPQAAFDAMKKMGYVPIVPKSLEAPFVQGTQKLLTSAASASSDFFQKAVQPLPVLGDVGAFLTRLGLSPQQAQQSVQNMFQANLVDGLKNSPLVMKLAGDDAEKYTGDLVQKLSGAVNEINSQRFLLTHPPITDWRQLTLGEIMKATGVSASEARDLAEVMNDAMLKISWAQRGLGTKLTDLLSSVNPGGKLSLNGYLRLQGAGRFAWNPFFQMKLAAKTEILSQLEAGGKWPSLPVFNKIGAMIFREQYATLGDTAKLLESKGIFGESALSGEATNDFAAGSGLFKSSGLLQSQKLSVAGLVTSMAKKVGLSPEEFIANFPNETRDTVQAILHYDPRNSFLNSPLARTLNFAFFPFRFNLKVSTFMARALQRQSAMTQIAVIHGTLQAHDFLTSQQGQAWLAQNSDAIGILTYFTPLETLNTVMAAGNILSHPTSITQQSIGSLGELGGLPIGFVTQLLNAEGLLHTQGTYLNPKTGQPSIEYVPNTLKAKLATALATFLGSLYTYPGATAGLPSKTSVDYGIAKSLSGAQPSEWTKVTPTDLTPEQQQQQQAIQQLQASQQGASAAQPPSQPPVAVPMTGTPTAQPFYKATGSSTPPTRKLKKSQEPLTALPGQAQIGQL